MCAETKKNTIQKKSDNEFVYLEVCLRFDFTNISIGVRTTLPLKGFLSDTWPIITETIISIAIREVALIIRTFHILHAE